MPYRLLVCNDCDMHVCDPGPHGPEDEHCEGDGGFEHVELYTEQEVERRLKSLASDVSERLDWIVRDRGERDKVLANVSTTRSVLIRHLALASPRSDAPQSEPNEENSR